MIRSGVGVQPKTRHSWLSKSCCKHASIIAFYASGATKIVSADASSYGMGAVLLQVQQDGRRAPIAYASCALSDAEKRYAQIKKEALAMTWVCERFQQILLGCDEPFTIETDHKPLLPIMNAEDLDQCPLRLQRLKIRLARLYFQVRYVPGKELLVADALSRSPVEKLDEGMAEEMETYVKAISMAGIPVSDVLFEEIRQATQADPCTAVDIAIVLA